MNDNLICIDKDALKEACRAASEHFTKIKGHEHEKGIADMVAFLCIRHIYLAVGLELNDEVERD